MSTSIATATLVVDCRCTLGEGVVIQIEPGGVQYRDLNGLPNQAILIGPDARGAKSAAQGFWFEDEANARVVLRSVLRQLEASVELLRLVLGDDAAERVVRGIPASQLLVPLVHGEPVDPDIREDLPVDQVEPLGGALAGDTLHVTGAVTDPGAAAGDEREVLGIERVSLNASFFDLGGTSLAGGAGSVRGRRSGGSGLGRTSTGRRDSPRSNHNDPRDSPRTRRAAPAPAP